MENTLKKNSAVEFVSVDKASKLLGLSTTAIRYMVDRDEIHGWKTKGGHRRIRLDSVMKILKDNGVIEDAVIEKPNSLGYKKDIKISIFYSSKNKPVLDFLPDLNNLNFDIKVHSSLISCLLDATIDVPDYMIIEIEAKDINIESTINDLELCVGHVHKINESGKKLRTVIALIGFGQELEHKFNNIKGVRAISGPISEKWMEGFMIGIGSSL